MQAAQKVSVRTGEVRGKGGHSLAARSVAAIFAGDYRFELEFRLAEGGAVWGVYKGDSAQPEYAVEVGAGDVIGKCNCPDAQCRKRACKHMILLSVLTGHSLRVGGSVLRFASALLANPVAIAEAVTRRAALVEAAQRFQAVAA